MMDDLRSKRGAVFAGLPDVDVAVLNTNDPLRIRSDPAIKRWTSLRDESGRVKKWPDLFYQPDKVGDIKYLFRVPWLHRVSVHVLIIVVLLTLLASMTGYEANDSWSHIPDSRAPTSHQRQRGKVGTG